MKRSLAILAIALLVAAGANSQSIPSLDGFKSAFEGFTNDFAGSLALNSTIGSNWSDAYIGSFPPHFGVGVTTGASFVNIASATDLFKGMGASLPSALGAVGLPIPAAVATLKIGIPFLPLDVGIKGGYIPSSVGDSLKSSTGVGVDYKNIGIQVRYALLKQDLLLPNISVGVSYNYQKGSVTAPSGLGSQTFAIPSSTYNITASDPAIALGWSANVFDITAQVSKKLLFIVPYAGLGYTLGTASVTGGVSSKMSTNFPGGISALNSYLATVGGPEITDQGFTYSSSASNPLFRVYGGLSLRLLIVDIDAQAMYVPVSKSFGASLTGRVQI